ncbi:F-box-like protein [Rhizoctonia solani]|uniref:F-box-like protein n=1 Tax=Rhizoctonia solani TaxID=456999 RepID=A0A8H8P6S5_9AGAM|nr:F-box-like protein [Rhizoctonia solani]QRW24587.1 F-box-like protein [Rhizoctonia solani]
MSDSIAHDALGEINKDSIELRKHRNSLQAVSRLPEDLLIEVFTIINSPMHAGSVEFPPIHFVHMVSQVCSQWRRTCLNNPLLWAHIYIKAFPLSSFADLCITRAKNAPITLNVTSSRQKLTVVIWKRLLKSLENRGIGTHRWKALVIRVSDFEVFPHLIEHLASYPTPNLESIFCATQTHRYFAESHPNRRPSSVPFLTDQPTLSNLSLPGLSSVVLKRVHLAHLFERNPPISFTRLTRLHLVEAGLGHYAPDAFALLLSSHPSLEEVSLNEHTYFQDDDSKSWSTITPVTFSFLRRLKLMVTDLYSSSGGMGLRWMNRFLQSIDAPGLNQLILIAPSVVPNTANEELVDVISTGYKFNRANTNESNPSSKLLYPALRYLGAIFPLPKDSRLYMAESMLTALPSLTHLRILSEDIAVLDRAPRCSSSLTHLFIQNSVFPKELGNILHRRQEAGLPIRTLGILGGKDVIGLPTAVELKRYDGSQAGDFLDL